MAKIKVVVHIHTRHGSYRTKEQELENEEQFEQLVEFFYSLTPFSRLKLELQDASMLIVSKESCPEIIIKRVHDL